MSNPTNADQDSRNAKAEEAGSAGEPVSTGALVSTGAIVSKGAIVSTGTAVAMVGHYRAHAGVHFEAHHHLGHELIVWRTGHIECRIGVGVEQQVVMTYPGMISLTPGFTVHSDLGLTPYSHVYLIFDSDLRLPGMERPRLFSDDEHGSLEHLLLAMEHEFNGDYPYRESMVELLHQQLAVRLLRLGGQREVSPAEKLVQQLERLIEERYASNPNLQELAAELSTSTSNLRAKFAKLRPYSPKAYLCEVRVKHALGHIRSSSLSLEAIAALSGYTSSGHLWRDVKHITGMTPGSFRPRGPAALGPGRPART